MHTLDLDILHRTDRYLAVDKPAGLLSVPGRGPHKRDSVQTRVRAAFPHATGPLTVHRLDMETSGVILLALDPDAHRALSKQFESRTVEKHYIALLRGVPDPPAGEINLPIRLDPDNRPRQVVDFEQGKPARTIYETIEWIPAEPDAPGAGLPPKMTRIRFTPITGRSHQLRLHAAAPARINGRAGGLGCPIAGDSLYGCAGDPSPRMMLHADTLRFTDPQTNERITINSPAPF